MKPYLKIAAMAWQEFVVYRLNLLLEIIGRFITSLVIFFVWFAVFNSRGGEQIGNLSLGTMFTYLFVAGLLEDIFEMSSQGDDINDDIREGRLGAWLVRPVSALMIWATRDVVRRLFVFGFSCLQWLAVFLLLQEFLVLPVFGSFALTLTVIIIALAMNYFLYTNISLLAFWWAQTWGPRFVLRVITPIVAGTFIPLSLFPEIWQQVFSYTPFPTMMYVPTHLIVFGYLPPLGERMILSGLVWLVVLIGLHAVIWRRGIREYDVVESV